MGWYVEVLKKYAVFNGRAHRREYWMFVLINFLISFGLGAVDNIAGLSSGRSYGVLGTLYGLAVFVPSLAVGVRRLHDTDRSGWWLLIGLVPLVGWLILLIFLATAGQRGDNRYGPVPAAELGGTASGFGGTASGFGAAPPASTPSGWFADPLGRHEMRYWDGRVWTGHVSDAGVASVDPL